MSGFWCESGKQCRECSAFLIGDFKVKRGKFWYCPDCAPSPGLTDMTSWQYLVALRKLADETNELQMNVRLVSQAEAQYLGALVMYAKCYKHDITEIDRKVKRQVKDDISSTPEVKLLVLS